jgi:hypothetical protein
MSEHLHHRLAQIHQNLLHGRLPRNLDWGDAVELIEHLGRVEPHGGEEFAFVVGSKREFFRRPHTHELGLEEVSRLRSLLRDDGMAAPAGASTASQRAVVVIDHHGARIYQDRGGSRPEDGVTVSPYDPHGFHRHLIHRKEAHYQGERVPEETSFYAEVARALAPARDIVLIGHGTGKSNAAEVLGEYLKAHHPETFRKVSATEVADLSAISEPEIEVLARRHLGGAA